MSDIQVLMIMVKNGTIEINQPIPAEEGTSMVIFIMPRIVEKNSAESLFGKWDWYTKEIEKGIHLAWERWAKETSSL